MSQAQKAFKPSGSKASTTVSRICFSRLLQQLILLSHGLAKKVRWLIALRHKEQKTSVVPTKPANSEPTTRSKSNRTVINALKLALQALSAASQSAPLPGLSLAFDSLLTVITKVEVCGFTIHLADIRD
jgi:hypothetical protein